MRTLRVLGVVAALASLCVAGCRFGGGDGDRPGEAAAPLIPREVLFGNPDRAQARISPDGRWLAYLAPRGGVRQLWWAPVASPGQARLLAGEQTGDLSWLEWSADGRYVLYLQDDGGDENWVLWAVDVSTGEHRALTPTRGASVRVLNLSPRDPAAALVALNDRDAGWWDVYSVDVHTGEREIVFKNERGFNGFWADRDNRLRLASRTLPSGEVEFWTREAMGEWRLLFTAPFEDSQSVRPIAFDDEGRSFLMFDSIGRDRAALVRVDSSSGEKAVLGESLRADVSALWINNATAAPQAYGSHYLKLDWQPLPGADAKADIAYLKARLSGDFRVVTRTRDDARWLVREEGPVTPPRVHLYDRRDSRSLRELFSERPQLDSFALQPMIPVEINARDGLTLVSYLTLPPGSDPDGDGRPQEPAPLVLLVHDGPWARDGYGFSAEHQWLANRGYAVLSVNFRGSTGFGKAFVNAGNREWGAKMQQDLLDAAAWAVSQGVAAPERVAIMGGGYGGYAVLSGLAFTPEAFACGVARAAPANLEAMLAGARPALRPELETLALRVGDPRTREGRALLRERSPLRRAGRIVDPLLLAYGENDVRVPRAETDQLLGTLRSQEAPATFLSFAGEGARFESAANRLAYFAVTEAFLGQCLGGRVEPFGDDLARSSLRVRLGADRVEGLEAAVGAAQEAAPTSHRSSSGLSPESALRR